MEASKMPSVTQLGYVRFGVSDLAAWRTYAVDVLGFMDAGMGKAGEAFYRIDSYNYRFIVAPTGEDDITLAGWEVKDEAAMLAVAARLEGIGISVVRGTEGEADERMVLGLCRYRDPDGLDNEIYYGPSVHKQPFISTQVVSGFKVGTLGMGHIVRAVDDIKLKAIFTHVNERHHTIALAPFRPAMGDAPAGKRLDHFMVELNTLDDVGYGLDRHRASEFASGELGKHTNDQMISFYGMTPSGFTVEYGTGGLLIEDDSQWEVANYEAFSFWGYRSL
jgi:hypothetical protein